MELLDRRNKMTIFDHIAGVNEFEELEKPLRRRSTQGGRLGRRVSKEKDMGEFAIGGRVQNEISHLQTTSSPGGRGDQ
jgi:hypothetical protein